MRPRPTLFSGSGFRAGLCWLVCWLLLANSALAQRDDYSAPPINYMTAESNDPVAKLARRLESGEAKLEFQDEHGYLRSVLDQLDVPISSQSLVFSKTSMQRSRITPRRPRAIYFNDDVYVGYCQYGDVLELAATGPRQGAIFYTLKQRRDTPVKFVRDRGHCLTCHSSSRTQNVPGYLVRSVFADASGMPEFGSGTFNTDHTSPFSERWGGWYVTGTHGSMRHMGNAIYHTVNRTLDRETHANLMSLDKLIKTSPYLSPHSDIVALMVMEHQAQMHNAIAWANYETRRALHQSEIMNKALERPEGFVSESAERRIGRAADRVLEHLLFCDEFRLTSAVQGSSSFAKEFSARRNPGESGNRDSRGRSLRDFDLKTRLFRHPCSYMIHSDAFAALPEPVRDQVLTRLRIILTQREPVEDDKYRHLSAADRRAILEILDQTSPLFAKTKTRAN